MSRLDRLLFALVAGSALAGCAPVAERRSDGLNWVVQQEAERQRLNDAGFPQFTGAQ